MMLLSLACANPTDSGKADADTGFAEARDTKEWTDAVVSELLVGQELESDSQPIPWGGALGGDLTGGGSPTIVAWGDWYSAEWSGSFAGVYPADRSGDQSLAESAEALLFLDTPNEGASLVSVPGCALDVTGDGIVDLVALPLDSHLASVYSGPLGAELTPDESIASIQLASPSFALWSTVSDIDGDGIGDLVAEDRTDSNNRIATWLGPFTGDLGVGDADGTLATSNATNTGVVRGDHMVLTDSVLAWLLPTSALTEGGTVEAVSTAEMEMNAAGRIGAVELDAPDDDAETRVWVGVPRAGIGELVETGAVFAFEDPGGVNEAADAVGTAWGYANCLGLGASLAHADNYADGHQGMWMGALGEWREDSGCDYSFYYGLWGVVSPLRGQAWVNQLDDAIENVETSTESGFGVNLVPWGIDAGDADGTGRDDLVIATQREVVVIRW